MAARAWIVDAVGAATFDRLVEGLGGSELQSLLLEVMHAPMTDYAEHGIKCCT